MLWFVFVDCGGKIWVIVNWASRGQAAVVLSGQPHLISISNASFSFFYSSFGGT